MRTPESETRVVPTSSENGYSPDGRWLAQYFDAGMQVWFDIGDPHGTRASAVHATLPDPDTIGDSEYRVVSQHVQNVIASALPAVAEDANADDELMDIVLASVNELIESAALFRRRFKSARSGSRLINDLLFMEEEVERISKMQDNNDRLRAAVELHGKMRRAAKELSKLPDGGEKHDAQIIAERATKVLLRDVFGLEV